jgi:hypothetical protein
MMDLQEQSCISKGPSLQVPLDYLQQRRARAYAKRGICSTREGHPCCKGGRLPAVCATPATVAPRALAWSIPFPGLEATGLEDEPAGGAGDRGWARQRRGWSRGGSMRPAPSSEQGSEQGRERAAITVVITADLRFRGRTLARSTLSSASAAARSPGWGWAGQDSPAQLRGGRGCARGSRARRGVRARQGAGGGCPVLGGCDTAGPLVLEHLLTVAAGPLVMVNARVGLIRFASAASNSPPPAPDPPRGKGEGGILPVGSDRGGSRRRRKAGREVAAGGSRSEGMEARGRRGSGGLAGTR